MTEQVPVTCYKTVYDKVPETCTVTVCKPEQRTRTVNVTKCRTEERVRTVNVTKCRTEERSRMVKVCKMVAEERTQMVKVCKTRPENPHSAVSSLPLCAGAAVEGRPVHGVRPATADPDVQRDDVQVRA